MKEISLPARVIPLDQLRPASLSRQRIRRMGFLEIFDMMRELHPKASRKQIREWTRNVQKKSWAVRDAEAVARLSNIARP